jgi:flagellar hook-associated protein 2
MRLLATRLQGIVSATFRDTGTVRMLPDVGVRTDSNTGLLSLDAAAVGAAVARDPAAVNALFSAAKTGTAAVTSALVQAFTRSGDGVLTSRTTSLQNLSRKIDDDVARLQARLDAYREGLVRQFAAMEDAVSKLKASGTFLTAQDNLANRKQS